MSREMTAPDRPWALPYPTTATEADIYACFRLLLGRNPNQEEWTGHSAMAGQDLTGVVASYVRSLEFSRRGLLKTDVSDNIVLAALPDYKIYCDLNDPAVGWHANAGAYEPEVAALFRTILRPGMGVIDIGANIGVFSLLSAALVGPSGFVLAVEPNQRNARMLEASRRANGFAQIKLAQVAAGQDTGLLALHASHSTGTTSELQDGPAAILAATTVPCVQVDCLVPAGRQINLIKIDVDGAEYPALLGCRETIANQRPFIISEFAPGMLQGLSGIDGERYLQWIADFNYQIAVIAPDGSLTPARGDWPAVMDIYRQRGTDHIDILASPA